MLNKLINSTNYFIMSEDFQKQQPSEGDFNESKNIPESTAQKSRKGQEERSKFAQSRREEKEKSPEDQELDQLEVRIQEIGDKLKDIHLEGLKVETTNFSKRRQLESLRRDLRKQLIDVGHDHKQLLINKEESERQKIKEQQEERLRKLQQEVKKVRQSRRQQSSKKQKQSQVQKQKQEEINQGQQTQNLTQSRRKARIIELQAELSGEDLRKSRRALIDYQLAALRLSYYPYRSRADLYPSYRYSYLSPYTYSYYI